MLRLLPPLALVAFLICLQIFPVYANDLWMHLLLGADTLSSGVPRFEEYSYTAAGRPFVYHEWLAGVVLYLVHRLAGPTGLILLQPAAALAVAFLLLLAARRCGADRDLSILLVGLAIYVGAFRMFARPHLLALPLLAAVWWLLLRLRERGGWPELAALAGVQILWTNLHGSFPEAVALAVLFVAGELLGRMFAGGEARRVPVTKLLLAPPILVGVSLLNPYGWELPRLAFLHPVDPLFRERIFEYFPAFGAAFRATWLFWPYVLWIVLLVVAVVVLRRRTDPALLLPALGFLGLSVWMNRAVVDFVLISFPLVAVGLGDALRGVGDRIGWRKPLLAAIPLLAAASATLAFGYRFDRAAVREFGFGVDPFTPVAVTDYLEETGFRGNVFCSFPYGSYLAYRLSPDARVVFDSRTIPYGERLYRDYREARKSLDGFLAHLGRYRVDAVLLNHRVDSDPGLHGHLLGSGDWEPVHLDERAVLYLRRTPENTAVLTRDGLSGEARRELAGMLGIDPAASGPAADLLP